MTPAPVPHPRPRDVRLSPLAAFLLFTASGILRLTYLYLDDVTRSRPDTFVRRLIEEGTGSYAALALFPLIVLIERRYPLARERWSSQWVPYFLVFAVFSVAHTTLLAVTRAVIFPSLGLGSYDYGRMPIRFFMEAPQDLIGFCTILGILTFLRAQQYLRDREVSAIALEAEAAKARLEALSVRLQPHFLFNALNTISSTVYDDPAAADQMIGSLGDLLRHALRTGTRQEVSVAEELETLAAYLAFVDARFGDRLACTFEVDPAATGLAVPALLLQPLVENAVKHGRSTDYENTHIDIAVARRASVLHVTVENAADVADEPVQVGTGLGATRDRLALLYGSAASLVTSSTPGRFRVTVEIPAHDAEPAPQDSALPRVHANADR